MNYKKILIYICMFFLIICIFIPRNNVMAIVLDESILEQEPTEGEIQYNSTRIKGKGNKILGKWKGLTYYSQADKRWANKLYTITNNKKQTMKSSGCGPTCGAMIVSSAKGEILPTTMAKIALDNGFRTKNNGTAWAFFSFIANYFEFKNYFTTTNFDKAINYLKQKNNIGDSKYYIVVSCGKGLFTNSGHYVVLAGWDNKTIQVFDSFLYEGKFNTVSRKKANVKIKGNSIYISEKNFKKYSNYRRFWIYSNDKGNEQRKTNSKIRYVKVRTQLNIRSGPGTNYKIVGRLKNGNKVKVYETKKGFSRIGNNKWVYSKYLTKRKEDKIKNTVGEVKRLKRYCVLYSKSNLTGSRYQYKKNTTVRILKNVSSTVDYIRVIVTGRKAYVKSINLK